MAGRMVAERVDSGASCICMPFESMVCKFAECMTMPSARCALQACAGLCGSLQGIALLRANILYIHSQECQTVV